MSVVGGPEAGQSVDLQSSIITVGAHPGNNLILTDRRVSGHHFEITLDERGYRLRDLHSTNGTWVAGHRVFDIYLNPGSVVYVGDARIRFDPQDSSVQVELSDEDMFGSMVGQSVPMRALFGRLERIAPTDANVLVTGETGTGKELVAEALHEKSPRANGPFVVVDCGSLPANLIESELFGHEKGAFTGAHASHAGVFERANGGTVFLDEIGELPMELQPKLLGALERRQVRRVGGKKMIPVDIRVVAATNRDLAKEMNQGTFREDLYYRLAVVRVHMPALRERAGDIPLLAKHFLAQIPGGSEVSLKPKTLEKLRNHSYPGNVRELRNIVERAVVMAQIEHTGLEMPSIITPGAVPTPSGAPDMLADTLQISVDASAPYKPQKQRIIIEFDRRYLTKLLGEFKGNVSRAARAAGLDRMTVHKMLSRCGIENVRGGG